MSNDFSQSSGDQQETLILPLATATYEEPMVVTETAGARLAPTSTEPDEQSEGTGKVKAAAIVAGVAAVANKARKRAPEKVNEIRAKRAAGRCVILTEMAGRPIAIGPYRDADAAQQSISKVAGTPTIVEVLSEQVFFEPPR